MIIEAANRLNGVSEYYFSTKLAQIREMDARGLDVINLGIGNPDGMPPETALQKLAQSSQQTGVQGYQSYRGIPELREAMSRFMEEHYQWKADPATEILPLIGSKEGIFHISMAYLNPGDAVLVPDPGYPTYQAVAGLLGAEVIHYSLSAANDWQPDLEALAQQDLSRVKLMWLNSPHMPTGSSLSPESIAALIDFARRQHILLVHDNPYTQILNEQPESLLAHVGAKEVLIELNSLSKSHNMAGWRMGWLSGAQTYIDTVLKVKSNMDSGMYKPLQLAAAEALRASKQWLGSQQQRYQARKSAVQELLDLLACTYAPTQRGLFVWAALPAGEHDAKAFAERLLTEARVFMPPGTVFGPAGEGYIRASLCVPVVRIVEAIERVKKWKS